MIPNSSKAFIEIERQLFL